MRNFDNQQGKDVKAKQHYCPLKQDHPTLPEWTLRHYIDVAHELYARHTKIWISQGVDWISTASGSERSLRQRSLATARGTDSSSQSRSWCAQHIGWISSSAKDVGEVVRDYRNYIHPH